MNQFDDLRERLHQRCTVIEASPTKRSELVAAWRAGWGTEVPWLVGEQEVSGVGGATHLAALMGGSPRAVGGANGRNPISIIVPCHRVVGSQCQLTGYTGGLDRKVALLELEGLQVSGSRVHPPLTHPVLL